MRKTSSFIIFVAFFAILVSVPFQRVAAESAEKLYPLKVRVLDDRPDPGNDWRGSYENRVETSLWKKIDPQEVAADDAPIVYCADGTVWQWTQGSRLYGRPSPHRDGVIDTRVPEGEYRVNVSSSKVYATWEGPPGSRKGGSSGRQDPVTSVWHHEVSGFGGPQRVYAWLLGDPIHVDGDRDKYEQKIVAEEGAEATFTVTAPPGDAEKLSLRLFREDGFYLEGGRAMSDYGLPCKATFLRLRPGRYTLCVFQGKINGNVPPPGADMFSCEITAEGPNDFTFAAEKSLAREAPWRIHGTVNDSDGQPIKEVTIQASSAFTGLYDVLTTQTDAEGNYTLPITPLKAFGGFEKDPATGKPAFGFRFQQLVLSASKGDYDKETKRLYSFVEQSRSATGDLIVIGDFATAGEAETLLERFADEKYDVVPVAKNKPVRIDFVLERRLKEREGMNDWLSCSAVWTEREADDRRWSVYRKIVFPTTLNLVYKNAVILSDDVSASLRFPKPEIMVGEPTNFEYVVRNDAAVDLCITLGGDYRGVSRPISFTVRAIRLDGPPGETPRIINEIPVQGFFGGGLSDQKTIPAHGGEYAFNLCLSCWLDLDEPGEYRIEAARRLNPSSRGWGSFERTSYSPGVRRIGTGTLKVVPYDREAFGKLIEQWGEEALTENTPIPKALDKLIHVEDKRAVPWLIKIATKRDNHFAKSALCKFDDDAALETLKADLDSPDTFKSHAAAANLSRSKHPGAIDVLLSREAHTNDSVRLTVVQAADRMERKAALEMLRNRFNDRGCDGSVGKEARRIYEKLTGEKTEQTANE